MMPLTRRVEALVPPDHPLRKIRELVREVLGGAEPRADDGKARTCRLYRDHPGPCNNCGSGAGTGPQRVVDTGQRPTLTPIAFILLLLRPGK